MPLSRGRTNQGCWVGMWTYRRPSPHTCTQLPKAVEGSPLSHALAFWKGIRRHQRGDKADSPRVSQRHQTNARMGHADKGQDRCTDRCTEGPEWVRGANWKRLRPSEQFLGRGLGHLLPFPAQLYGGWGGQVCGRMGGRVSKTPVLTSAAVLGRMAG